MATAACLPIAADRAGPCVRTIYFEGLDLTGVSLAMEFRLNPETPGPAAVALGMGAAANAEGLRLISVVTTDGVPTSQVVLRINETTMKDALKVPYIGELGSASSLYYDLIGIFGQDKRRLIYGTFTALPTVYGMNNAPSSRRMGWSEGISAASGMMTGAKLTFGDEITHVVIDGADLLGPLAMKAQDALDKINDFTRGEAGPANSTYISRAALKAAPVTNASYIFAPRGGTEGSTTAGTFLYQTADAPYTADDVNIIKLDAVPLTTGALVRQGAPSIQALGGGSVQDRIDQQGYNPENLATQSGTTAQKFQRTIASANGDVSYPTTRIGRGKYLLSAGQVVPAAFGNLIGEGVNATYLHNTGPAGTVMVEAKNYGGRTEFFGIDAGAPGDVSYDEATDTLDLTAARSVVRHGFLFDWFAGHGTVRHLETRWLNGYGFKFVDAFDFTAENLITRDCGSADQYAFQMVHGTDTCNHYTITRLQVEDSYVKAIYFDEFNLNGVVDGIHCEGTRAVRGTYAVVLRGTAMNYRNARIAADDGDVDILIGGASSVFDRITGETNTIVDYSWFSSLEIHRSFVTHCSFDTVRIPSDNVGKVTFRGTAINSLFLTNQPKTVRFEDCVIGDVYLDGNTTDVEFVNCRLTGGWTMFGNPTVRAKGCSLVNLPTAAIVYTDDCDVANNYTTQFGQKVRAHSTRFAGNLSLSGNGALVWLTGAYRVGGLGYVGGDAYGAMGPEGECFGPINPAWYGTGGAWPEYVVRWRRDVGPGGVIFHSGKGSSFVAGPMAS